MSFSIAVSAESGDDCPLHFGWQVDDAPGMKLFYVGY